MASDPRAVVRASDVPAFEHTPGGSVRFISGRERGVGLTVALSDNPAGGGSRVHRHSCGEVFVVYEGCGTYLVDGVEIRAEAGDVVFVPANTWHSFRAAEGDALRHVAAFDAAEVETEIRPPPQG